MAFGIPATLNDIASKVNQVGLLVADGAQILNLFQSKPKWGIYKDGKPVIIADSVVSVEYQQEYRISNYPQEDGAFQSYNKVATPYDARVTYTKGGSGVARQDFLNALEKATASLDLVSVVTPEKTYTSANVVHYNYRRTSDRGANLLTVDVWVTEVRVTVVPGFSKTVAPTGALPVNIGSVLPVSLPPLPSLPSLPSTLALPSLPSFNLPTFSLPSFNLPSISLPSLSLPTLPSLNVSTLLRFAAPVINKVTKPLSDAVSKTTGIVSAVNNISQLNLLIAGH